MHFELFGVLDLFSLMKSFRPFFYFSPAVDDVQNVQIVCVWCQKEGVKRYSLCMGSELKSFCSEKCFAACRRAYFKRNKVGSKGNMQLTYPPHFELCPVTLLIRCEKSGYLYGNEWAITIDCVSLVDAVHTFTVC